MPTLAEQLAAQLKDRFGATVPTSQAATELRRQHAEIVAQKCADTWCTSRNAETLETARAAIAAAGGKVSRNTEPER